MFGREKERKKAKVQKHFEEIGDFLFEQATSWLALEAYSNSNVSPEKLLEKSEFFLKKIKDGYNPEVFGKLSIAYTKLAAQKVGLRLEGRSRKGK